eukprot:2152250-Amphidinium_carterae.1
MFCGARNEFARNSTSSKAVALGIIFPLVWLWGFTAEHYVQQHLTVRTPTLSSENEIGLETNQCRVLSCFREWDWVGIGWDWVMLVGRGFPPSA